MHKFKPEKGSIIAWMMLILWGLFFCNDLCNRHSHQDKYGNLISHVHYSPDAEEDHKHSDQELLWLDMISNPSFQLVNILNSFIAQIETVTENKILTYDVPRPSLFFVEINTLRGPPGLA